MTTHAKKKAAAGEPADAIREVTDAEVDFYVEHGWVKLDGFLSTGLTEELMAVGQRIIAEAERLVERTSGGRISGEVSEPSGLWRAQSFPQFLKAHSINLEPFRSLKLSKSIGRASQRLMNTKRLTDDEVGVRLLGDHLIYKPARGEAESGPTPFHQETFGGLMIGQLGWWIALDEVTPEQGAMRYLTGCHREGRLMVDLADASGRDPEDGYGYLERYPKLTDLYDWSPPLHYRPGDATVHHEFMLHGAPENATTKARWSLNLDYCPANAVAPRGAGDGLHPALLEAGELERRRPLVFP
jgi:hypothetical protein